GSVIVIVIGTLIAFPVGLATAIFLAEYRRPAWLATVAESAIDVIFGVPSIVFALFGVAVFTSSNLIFLSSKVGSSGLASGKSFLVAGIVFSLMALPPIVKASQEALFAVSNLQREASLALGTSKFRTIRRIVLPQARSGIATGTVLGIGRIAGDTAIVWLLLGGAIQMTRSDWYTPGAWGDTLRETGSTLTSYLYFTSP